MGERRRSGWVKDEEGGGERERECKDYRMTHKHPVIT